MGQCCGRGSPQRYEGVEVPVSEQLGPSYSTSRTLSDADVKTIMRQILFVSHNSKLYDKVGLASKRSKELKNGVTQNYVELVKETKEMEKNCFVHATAEVLNNFKIDPEDFGKAKSSINMKNMVELLMPELFLAIRKSMTKLNMNDDKLSTIRNESQEVYHDCNFKLGAVPETSRKLADIYHSELPITYEDVMAADALYAKYGLLPIEVQAFLMEER
eukprot:TRINITY_DN1998_c0_g1_i10.p1 TRINITY_DN1998_c0_g1~~TRINITY_DN1998_c0_g1_i10.p1  ORF type:complete len:217 (-),score=91.30 TRINITY_DN1998_c0_g1_i10:173-823(-)